MKEHERLRIKIMDTVIMKLQEQESEKPIRERGAEAADEIMEAVYEDFRSLTEVENIVETVQAGGRVQIPYWDPEEDAVPDGLPDQLVVRPCWGREGSVPASTMEAAGEAAESLIKARQQGTMSHYEAMMKLRELETDPGMERVYVCSQYATRGNREINLEMAKYYCMMVMEEGRLPICPHLFFGGVLNDDAPQQRAAGMSMGLELLKDCQELRIFSEISEGMAGEILKADEWGIPVRVADMALIYSADQAALYENDILRELEEVRSGKEHHTEKDGSGK